MHKAPLGNQSERNTSCVDSLISDKPNRACVYRERMYIEKVWENIDKGGKEGSKMWSHTNQEMRGYTQIEGQSTQGSDKWTLSTCMYTLEECK